MGEASFSPGISSIVSISSTTSSGKRAADKKRGCCAGYGGRRDVDAVFLDLAEIRARVEVAEDGLDRKKKMQGRVFREFTDGGRQVALAVGTGRLISQSLSRATAVTSARQVCGVMREVAKPGEAARSVPSPSSTAICVSGSSKTGDHSRGTIFRRQRLAGAGGGEQDARFAGPDADHLDGALTERAGNPRQCASRSGDCRRCGRAAGAAASNCRRRRRCIGAAVDEVIDRRQRRTGRRPRPFAHSTGSCPRENRTAASPLRKMLPHPLMHGNVDEGIRFCGHRRTWF